MNRIILGDNLVVLSWIPDESVDLVYIDPPFNIGKTRKLTQIRTIRDEEGDRTGFGGRRYRTEVFGSHSYEDSYEDYYEFLKPRLIDALRVLKPTGSFYFHIDYREVHYCKVLIDSIFGRENFLNEIIWAYDFGGRTQKKWPAKHDNILFYVKDLSQYYFSTDEVDRIPYLAPALVGAEKAGRGKFPTDVFWCTIVPTNGPERTGYPTQKPLSVMQRIVNASSPPGGVVLDFFAGSGTTGIAANLSGRSFILVDSHPDAMQVMRKRFADIQDISWEMMLMKAPASERT